MSELRKATGDYAYFLTFTVVGWIDLFTRKQYCDIIIDSLKFCQENKALEIYAYVIMPSHIHLVARRKDGLMSDLIRDFKSYTAKTIIKTIVHSKNESRKEWLLYMMKYFAKHENQNKTYMMWQKTNHPIELFTSEVIDQKIEYIHQNPVVAGICTEDSSYQYSSANPFASLNVVAA